MISKDYRYYESGYPEQGELTWTEIKAVMDNAQALLDLPDEIIVTDVKDGTGKATFTVWIRIPDKHAADGTWLEQYAEAICDMIIEDGRWKVLYQWMGEPSGFVPVVDW